MLRYLAPLLLAVMTDSGSGAAASPPVPSLPPMPRFGADLAWMKLPHGWILGEVSAVDVDATGKVWVLQRPRTLSAADRSHAAPPVLQFAADGTYLRGFGGDGAGYDWPQVEHSLAVDRRGHVWISGNFRSDPATSDDALLEFDGTGRFVRQIGGRGTSKDGTTASVGAAADLFVDDTAHEIYVADGYTNRRLIVFDTRNGRFKRMWGAFGEAPFIEAAPTPRAVGTAFAPEGGDGPHGFNGVHGVEVSRDGLVYVSDRNNQRIQVFTKGGRYLRQAFVDRNFRSPTTASGIAFSPDRGQRYLYVADWGNAVVVVLDRATLRTIGRIGDGATPPLFTGPHLIATDRRGVLYVGDPQARRLVRLVPKSSDSGR